MGDYRQKWNESHKYPVNDKSAKINYAEILMALEWADKRSLVAKNIEAICQILKRS